MDPPSVTYQRQQTGNHTQTFARQIAETSLVYLSAIYQPFSHLYDCHLWVDSIVLAICATWPELERNCFYMSERLTRHVSLPHVQEIFRLLQLHPLHTASDTAHKVFSQCAAFTWQDIWSVSPLVSAASTYFFPPYHRKNEFSETENNLSHGQNKVREYARWRKLFVTDSLCSFRAASEIETHAIGRRAC